MKTNYEVRYSAHPEDAKHYDTARLRRDFLIETIFTSNEVKTILLHAVRSASTTWEVQAA